MRIRLLFSIFCFVLLLSAISASIAVQLSDQGSNIKSKSTGNLLSSGSLTVTIYDAPSGGNTTYNETFSTAIFNGSWSVMLGENSSNPLSLEFGKAYYKDYIIAGENVNFTNTTGGTTDRQIFYSPLGDIDINGRYLNNSANLSVFGLNLSGSLNSSGTVYVAGNTNLTVGYLYAVNNTWNANYSNFSAVHGYALNSSLWTSNYSNFSVVYGYATNNSGIIWSTAYNGTLAKTDAANIFGNFNQTFNGTTLFLWSFLNRIGIGTTTPQTTLDVVGTINGTTVYSGNNNLTVAYLYATNNTYAPVNETLWTDNFTKYNSTWSSITNSTYHTGYLYATNGTYLTVETNWNANYSDYLTTKNYALNDSLWTSNYSNFSTVVYPYATNGSGWVANYSNLLTKIDWATVNNGTLATQSFANSTFLKKTGDTETGSFVFNATTGNLTVTNSTGYNIAYFNATNGNVGIGTNTSTNPLDVIGNINGTSVYSGNKNLTIAYLYATNGTFLTAETSWNANYSNFSTVYGYATNSTTWSAVANGTMASWAQVTNGTMASWANAVNGTLAINSTIASWATNNFLASNGSNGTGTWNFNGGWQSNGVTIQNGNLYAQTVFVYNITSLNVNNLAVNGSLLPQVGWNNTFDVGNSSYYWKNIYLGGDANIVGNVYSAGRNLTLGYIYATNNTWDVNYSNFSRIYGNVTDYNSSWSSITNATYHTGYLYATNGTYLTTETNWNANYSNFSTLYANQLGNASSSGISWATANNGTLLNYSNALNGTLLSTSTFNTNYSTNDPVYRSFANNYSDYLAIRTYATNASLWSLNYSNFSTVVYGYAINSTGTLNGYANIALTNQSNTFTGNQTFDTSTFFIDSVSDRVGIGTTSPTVPFEVNGTINASQVLVNGTPVSSGGISWATANNGTLLNYSSALNGTLATWANAVNGTLALNSSLATYSAPIGEPLWSATANYSNFSTIVYGYAVNSTGSSINYSNILSNQTYNFTNGYFNLTNQTGTVVLGNNTGLFINGSVINFNLSNIIYPYAINNTWQGNFSNFSTITYPYAVNGSTFALNYSNFSNIYAMEYNNSLRSGTNNTFLGAFNVSNTSLISVFSINASGKDIRIGNGSFVTINAVLNFTNRTQAALTCGASMNGTLQANASGLWWCNGSTLLSRVGAG